MDEYKVGDIVEYEGIKLKVLSVVGKVSDGCNTCYCLHHHELCAYNGNPITGYCCAKDRNAEDDVYFTEVKE
jgi:hypothetical protein